MAHERGGTPLGAPVVQQAWSELQQLPAPWNSPAVTAEVVESAIEFGELDGELAAATLDGEEELPASIPMSISCTDGLDTDALQEMSLSMEALCDAEGSNVVPTPAYDPFEELFGQEEVVVDQYYAFESDLLARAPRVINRLDTAFAGELLDCQIQESSSPAAEIVELSGSESDASCLSDGDTELDPEEDGEINLQMTSEPTPLEAPGDILIVEDEGRPQVSIVPGCEFRQHFNCLETQQSPARIG